MKKIPLLITLISISLAACGGKDKSAPKISDPQQPIEVGAGEEFSIILESNPTTGYHWDIVGDLDRNVVEFIKTEYTSNNPNLVGGGGLDVWTFKSVKTGGTQITLGYYPPSNDPVDPQQTTTFTVVVE